MTQIAENIAYRMPLALHCVDTVTGVDVGAGLTTAAWLAGDLTSLRVGAPSPFSALIGFPDLPGFRRYELAAARGSLLPPLPDPAEQLALVSIADTQRRFLPALLRVAVPITAPVPVPLYSMPSRPTPSGWATVRGEVHSGGGAAAWSVVVIDTGADQYETIADSAGRFLLYLPYPEALPPLQGSPPVGHGIGEVSWPITVSVGYEPTAQIWPVATQPPLLDSILGQSGALLQTSTGTDADLPVTLVWNSVLTLSLEAIPA